MQRACLAHMKPWVQSLALYEIELVGTVLSSRHLGSGGRDIRSSKVIFSYVLRSRAPWDTLDYRLSPQKKKKIITLIVCVYMCAPVCMCVYRTENTFGCCFSGTVHLSRLNCTLLVCLFCLCAHVHMVHVWSSENNSLTSLLSSHCVGPRD